MPKVAPAQSLTDFSPSRVSLAGKCGLAFRYRYIDKVPDPSESAARLFGTVVHAAVEEWYGMDDEPQDHTQIDLVQLTLDQWSDRLPKPIWTFVDDMVKLDAECAAVANAIQAARQVKAPTQTKAYQESEASIAFAAKRNEMLEFTEGYEEINWPKDEDPFKAYKKSAEIAGKIEERWKHLPRPIAVERPFSIEFDTFTLRGQVDQVRQDPNENGEAVVVPLDIKTGRNLFSQMEAFLQAFIYDAAIQTWDDIPDTEGGFVFYHARKGQEQRGTIDRERHHKLALRILNGAARRVTMGAFEPNYGFWCKRCDYADVCTAEISLWDGDGIVVSDAM